MVYSQAPTLRAQKCTPPNVSKIADVFFKLYHATHQAASMFGRTMPLQASHDLPSCVASYLPPSSAA
eukprot:8944711-Pyramimonas_sp.AAC.1